MPSARLFSVYLSLVAALGLLVKADLPGKIYGVNLGSWLLIEPWMLPQEWLAMGGENCADCSECIMSEFAFAHAYPDSVDEKFEVHWNTWFSKDDVDDLVDAGINTVRIPVGYWIVEALVDRTSEFYPRGGMKHLRRGLKQLNQAGISVILDHHALPGVHTPKQMFAGRCTDNVQFYTPYNYHRALVWTAVMTILSHVDPAFAPVGTIQAVNEPIMDASKTPGYGGFQKNFVQVVRAVEFALGIPIPGMPNNRGGFFSGFFSGSMNLTTAMNSAIATNSESPALPDIFNDEVLAVFRDTIPIVTNLAMEYTFSLNYNPLFSKKGSLVTNFMDVNWQYNNPSNPADAKIGPQVYDNHIYYSFGGVAEPNEEAYLTHVCNLDRIQKDATLDNSPLLFGEWGLSTQFVASNDFLNKWADAQKYSYSKGAGWIFWNFKIEESDEARDIARQWSYMEGIRRGFLTKNPSQLKDPHVCDHYINKTTTIAPRIFSGMAKHHRRHLSF